MAGASRRLDEVIQVEAEHYLRGRERPPPEDGATFGRREGDTERLFPQVSSAAAAVTGEVEVNGKVLKLWTFQQLEALSQKVLRDRAYSIRDAVGEGCPPIPSVQTQELIRWILHMQTQLTGGEGKPPVGRMPAGGYGSGMGHLVPASFVRDSEDRPITEERQPGKRLDHGPFGLRSRHEANRDNYQDLVLQRNEFQEAPNLGIETGRPGGEGRRHLQTHHNMFCSGVSTVERRSEGRRYLGCDDHLMEQKAMGEAPPRPGLGRSSPRSGKEPVRHVSESHFGGTGADVYSSLEDPVTGQRRRHIEKVDRMHCQGTSAPEDPDRGAGRKYLDSFAGSKTRYSDSHGDYQSTWKKEPTRLRGSSQLV